MTIHEIDKMLRDRHPDYRAVNAREVEAMRLDVAAYAGKAQRAEYLAAKLRRVEAVMADLRAAGNIAAADAIRNALK